MLGLGQIGEASTGPGNLSVLDMSLYPPGPSFYIQDREGWLTVDIESRLKRGVGAKR